MPPSHPSPAPRWKAGCVLYSCIFKVGRWAWSRRPRTALNCKRALKQLLAEPWTARLEGAARAASARPARVGTGLGSWGRSPLVDPPIPEPGPRPGSNCWGRRGVAVLLAGSGPCASLQGAWHSLASLQLPGRPDPRPPTSKAHSSEPRLDSEAVLGTELGRATTKDQLFMGRLGMLPRPALPLASLGKWGDDRGKVPRAKLATFLIFPSKY